MKLRANWFALMSVVFAVVVGGLCAAPIALAQDVDIVTITYGPYIVPAATDSGPGNLHPFEGNLEMPCTDGYIVGIAPDMIYADGSSANFYSGCMMHHVVFYNLQANDLTCPNSGAERFFAAGN